MQNELNKFEDFLNLTYGYILIGGRAFEAGEILKTMDYEEFLKQCELFNLTNNQQGG